MSTNDGDEIGFLPLTDCSFQILIKQYEADSAAARAAAARGDVDGNLNYRELTVVARYMEELSEDAKRLRKKLHDTNRFSSWLPSDVATLRMMGFDVRSITGVDDTHAHRVGKDATPDTQLCHTDAHCSSLLLLAEQRALAQQQRADALFRENAVLRETLEMERSRFRPDSTAIAELADSVQALKEVYVRKRDRLAVVQEMREKFAVALREIRAEDRRLAQAVQDSDLPFSVVEETFSAIRQIDASRRVKYILGPSCKETNLIDEAVLRLLHDLDFPFPVSIRRVGPGGDYFIDRRVRIKIANGQLLVRPVVESTASIKPPYEHLAKYLIHLYSPAIDLDKFDEAVGRDYDDTGGSTVGEKKEEEREVNSSVAEHSAATDVDNRLGHLLRQQQALRQSLAAQSAEMQWHQKQLVVDLSPSPATQREQSEEMKSRYDGTDKLAHFLQLLELNGSSPDFSTLSESELRELRRAAMQKQVRTHTRSNVLLSPQPKSESR